MALFDLFVPSLSTHIHTRIKGNSVKQGKERKSLTNLVFGCQTTFWFFGGNYIKMCVFLCDEGSRIVNEKSSKRYSCQQIPLTQSCDLTLRLCCCGVDGSGRVFRDENDATAANKELREKNYYHRVFGHNFLSFTLFLVMCYMRIYCLMSHTHTLLEKNFLNTIATMKIKSSQVKQMDTVVLW